MPGELFGEPVMTSTPVISFLNTNMQLWWGGGVGTSWSQRHTSLQTPRHPLAAQTTAPPIPGHIQEGFPRKSALILLLQPLQGFWNHLVTCVQSLSAQHGFCVFTLLRLNCDGHELPACPALTSRTTSLSPALISP